MNIKRLILLAAMFVLMVACAQEPAKVERSATPIPDETTAPSPAPVRTGVTILANGVVQAVQPALPLAFETGGKLLVVHVQPGDLVQAGDLIATLSAASIAQAELNVIRAQQTLDDIYANSDLDAALALLAVEEAQKAMDDLLNSNLVGAAAWQAVVEAQDAVEDAQRDVYISQATAGQADIDAAYAAMLLTEKALERQQENFENYAHLREDSLRRASAQSSLSAAQQAYDNATRTYNALTSTMDEGAQAVADARLATAQAQLADAQREWERVKEGPSAGNIARVEAELAAAQAKWEVLKDGPDPAKISLAQSELSLAQAQAALADAQLIAPWTGTVLSVDAAPGALVSSGSPIVTLLDTTQLEFHTTNLSERDLAQIFPGQTAVVTLKAYPNEPIEAAVVRIGLLAGAAVGDAVTFPVMLVLSETDLDIRPGMTGRVDILREE
jgi:multidrug efflux pump subunit AcrA (membrane-fusion protein)